MRNLIAGMDEAGRGPVLGPLVIGLVACTKQEIEILKELGVDDSKALSEKKRENLANSIMEIAEIADTLVVSAKEINELMEDHTLNEIEVLMFKKLIRKYSKRISELYLDAADVKAERFGEHFSEFNIPVVVSEHKADSKYIVVAAASIIAKTERDRQMRQLQDKYSKEFPNLPKFGKGYPANAKEFLKEYYLKYWEFPPITRKRWKTAKKIEKENAQNSLEDFI